MDVSLTLSRRDVNRFVLFLVAVPLLLIGAYFVDRLLGSPIWFVQRLVDIDGENSFPSWFSSIQLFLIGAFLLLKAWRCNPDKGPVRWFYLLGAAGFVFLSADEALFIHESVTEALLKYDALFRFSGDHGMWIPIYGGAALFLIALSWRQIARFWTGERRGFQLMAAGAGLFLFGAVGLEIVAYEFITTGSWVYILEVAAEEFLEMLGASVILYGSIDLLMEPAPRRPQAELVEEEASAALAA